MHRTKASFSDLQLLVNAWYYRRFAAESRKSHGHGSVKVVNGALAAVFFDFGNFPFLLKSGSKSSFFCFGVGIHPVVELQIAALCGAVVRNIFVFCKSVSSDLSGMAASRFLLQLHAWYYCVFQLRVLNRIVMAA